MVSILPGFSRESSGFTMTQFTIYAVEHYILIGLYTFAFVLVIVDIWTILIRQKRYKTIPLSAFYVFSFFTILLRLIFIIIIWSKLEIFAAYINDCYLTTKLGVGLI